MQHGDAAQAAALVEAVNRYLKRIVVKRVKLADFKPSVGTIERGQIGEVTEEFRQYLEDQIADVDDGEDTLPMLQIE